MIDLNKLAVQATGRIEELNKEIQTLQERMENCRTERNFWRNVESLKLSVENCEAAYKILQTKGKLDWNHPGIL
jgi:hypothetical protein